MPTTRLVKIGFEIEGEFHPTLNRWLSDVSVMKSDGSLRPCGECHTLQLGEYNSPVYNTTTIGLKSIKKFFDELDKYYKKEQFHFNQSCGFHIHVSFNQFPSEFFSKQFVAFFLKALKTKQKRVIEKRSGNRFCQLKVPSGELIRGNGADRYRFVNLWPAYERHGTIEFRIYPSDEPKKMYRYIIFTIGQIRKFLDTKIKTKSKINLNFNDIEEARHNTSCSLAHQTEAHSSTATPSWREIINHN